MRLNSLAIAMLCSACGAVSGGPVAIADAAIDGPVPTTYHGVVNETSPPVSFGGPPYCSYTMTLRQLDIQLGIKPSGELVSGQVEALYHEQVVVCADPPANEAIMHYTLTAAVPASGGMMLSFQEKAGDHPGATLSVVLTPAGPGYQAQFSFHRTDLAPPFDWRVVTAAVLGKL